MNNNGNLPSIGSQYNRDEFKREFQLKSKELWNSMPLFVSIIVSTKVCLYITSWVTSSLNHMICVHPSNTLFSFQLWRLFTATLATDSWFDLMFIMTFCLIKTISPQEYLKGTAHALVVFLLKSGFYVFVMSVFAIPLGPSGYFICGFIPINVSDICLTMLAEPNKQIDMCMIKISAQNLVYVILGFVWIFMGQPISSIIAISALGYFNPLSRLGEDKVQLITAKFEIALSKIPANINGDQAQLNLKMDTDSLVPFDRNKIKGRVSQQISRPSSAQSTESSLTRPSSSASNFSEGGIQLGGERQRDNSNLLNISIQETIPKSENFQDDLQDIKFDA